MRNGSAGPQPIRGSQHKPSAAVRERVAAACKRQAACFRGSLSRHNRTLTPKQIEDDATPSDEALIMLESAMERLRLSARAYTRILDVARPASRSLGADLATAEAIQLRKLNRASV